MAVPFRTAVPSRFTGSTGSLSIPANAVQTGDGMLIVVSWDNTAALTNPSGWTQQGTDQTIGSRTSRLLARIAASSSGSTVVFNLDTSVAVLADFVAYAGPYASLAAFIDDVQVSNDGSASTSHSAPTATFNGTGEIGVSIWTEQSANSQWTAPAGTTIRVADVGSGGAAFSTLIVDNGGGAGGTPSRLAQPRFSKPTLTSPTSVSILDNSSGVYYVAAGPTGDANVTEVKNRVSGGAFGPTAAGQGNSVNILATTTLTNPGPLTSAGLWDPNHVSDYRRGYYVTAGAAGKVAYIAGLYLKGSTASEGIQTNTPSECRIAHCRFDRLYMQDLTTPGGGVDNHPDLVQAMRADGGVQISWVAGVTDMQGFMAKHETSLGASAYPFYNLDNCLVHGGDNGLILLNIVDRTYGTNYRFENVCIIPSKLKTNAYGLDGGLSQAVIPNTTYTDWPLVLTHNADGTISLNWPAAESNPVNVNDAVTNGTTTVTSATANFTSNMQYRSVTGTRIPAGTIVNSVTNSTTIVLSNAATGSGSGGSLIITPSITQVGKGVYYDPVIAAMDPQAALEAWLPAALVGDNYNSSLYT